LFGLISQSNPAVYQYLRSITNHKGIPATIVFNDTHASTDYDKVNLFNNYFSSVFTKDSCATSDLPYCSHPDTYIDNYIDNIEIFEEEVFEALTSLDPNKAMRID